MSCYSFNVNIRSNPWLTNQAPCHELDRIVDNSHISERSELYLSLTSETFGAPRCHRPSTGMFRTACSSAQKVFVPKGVGGGAGTLYKSHPWENYPSPALHCIPLPPSSSCCLITEEQWISTCLLLCLWVGSHGTVCCPPCCLTWTGPTEPLHGPQLSCCFQLLKMPERHRWVDPSEYAYGKSKILIINTTKQWHQEVPFKKEASIENFLGNKNCFF